MNPIVIAFLYIFVGLLTLVCSRRTVRNGEGFTAVFDAFLLVTCWPVCFIVRMVIFVVEGNLWENLS